MSGLDSQAMASHLNKRLRSGAGRTLAGLGCTGRGAWIVAARTEAVGPGTELSCGMHSKTPQAKDSDSR